MYIGYNRKIKIFIANVKFTITAADVPCLLGGGDIFASAGIKSPAEPRNLV